MQWLRDIPLCVVNAHVEMLPRLDADEALARANSTGVGAGLKPGDWVTDQIAEWERTANGGRRPRRAAAKASPAALQSIGIGLQVVKRG